MQQLHKRLTIVSAENFIVDYCAEAALGHLILLLIPHFWSAVSALSQWLQGLRFFVLTVSDMIEV